MISLHGSMRFHQSKHGPNLIHNFTEPKTDVMCHVCVNVMPYADCIRSIQLESTCSFVFYEFIFTELLINFVYIAN